jgi:hypothetical protein
MKTLFFFVCLAVVAATPWSQAAEPLGETRLQEIIASPHSETALVEALSIYPKARKYQIQIENKEIGGAVTHATASATEKWVNGQYIVSEAQPGGPEMVVEYDLDSGTYRKYLFMGGRQTGYQTGKREGSSRSVNWVDASPVKIRPGDECLTTETHTDNTTVWVSLFYTRDVLIRKETGTATVVK